MQYFDSKKLDVNNLEETVFVINDIKYKLKTAPGVFSRGGLDFGTRLLLETLPVDKMDDLALDIGCGAGPIGIYLAKNTKCLISMSDINEAAVELSKINLELNGVSAEVYLGDGYEKLENFKFKYIVTNPPIRVGYKKLVEIIRGAKEYLTPSGELYYVIRKKQGAERLIEDTSDIYDNEVIKKKKGYFIVKATIKNNL